MVYDNKWWDNRTPWLSDIDLGHLKILGGLYGIQQPGKGHTGIFSNRFELYELAGDCMSFAIDKLNELEVSQNDPYGAPGVLARRSRDCRPSDRNGCNEFKRFELWTSSVELMGGLLIKPRRLYRDDLMAAQERIIIQKFNGQPGVYILQHSECMEHIYIGKGKDLVKRALEHRGVFLRLVSGYPTASERLAIQFEDSLHDRMKEIPGVRWTSGTEGSYIVKGGLAVVDQIVTRFYRHFLHQTVKIEP